METTFIAATWLANHILVLVCLLLLFALQLITIEHRDNRTMLLVEALDNLPISLLAYVVYAVRQQRSHIVSRNVNSLYCVVKSQLENEFELMAEDAAHLNQLFDSLNWQHGDDQSGFFDGVHVDTLLNKVMLWDSQPLIFDFVHPYTGANTVIVPYKHLQLNDMPVPALFGSHPVPTLTETNFGVICV